PIYAGHESAMSLCWLQLSMFSDVHHAAVDVQARTVTYCDSAGSSVRPIHSICCGSGTRLRSFANSRTVTMPIIESSLTSTQSWLSGAAWTVLARNALRRFGFT